MRKICIALLVVCGIIVVALCAAIPEFIREQKRESNTIDAVTELYMVFSEHNAYASALPREWTDVHAVYFRRGMTPEDATEQVGRIRGAVSIDFDVDVTESTAETFRMVLQKYDCHESHVDGLNNWIYRNFVAEAAKGTL